MSRTSLITDPGSATTAATTWQGLAWKIWILGCTAARSEAEAIDASQADAERLMGRRR
jgi:hypothetical protein